MCLVSILTIYNFSYLTSSLITEARCLVASMVSSSSACSPLFSISLLRKSSVILAIITDTGANIRPMSSSVWMIFLTCKLLD